MRCYPKTMIAVAILLLCPIVTFLLWDGAGAISRREVMPINPSTARMIRPEMTRALVRSLLGRPPGDYASGKVAVLDVATTLGRSTRTDRWIGNDYAIYVIFDDDGRVKEAICYEVVALSKVRGKEFE